MTPDTKTIAGKIAVMQAFLEGKEVQTSTRLPSYGGWMTITKKEGPSWNWEDFDYRIHPICSLTNEIPVTELLEVAIAAIELRQTCMANTKAQAFDAALTALRAQGVKL